MKPTITLTWDAEQQGVTIESQGFMQPSFMAAVLGMAKECIDQQAKVASALAMQQQLARQQHEANLANKLFNGRR